MSPTMSAEEVAAFYRDETARIRYSMIVFNWFAVGLIPILVADRDADPPDGPSHADPSPTA